jgi:hypothetical protein
MSKFLPGKLTFKNDKKDGGDQDKSVRLVGLLIFAAILAAVLFGKVFKAPVTFGEVAGFILLVLSGAYLFGLFGKFYPVEGEKTMINTVIWGAGTLAALVLMFA